MKRCTGPIFPERPTNLSLVKYPAVARIGESGTIIPTVYTYGELCGIYTCADWCNDEETDVYTPSGLHVYDSKLWYLMAEYTDLLFAAILHSDMAYVIFSNGVNGIMFLKDRHIEEYDNYVAINKSLKRVGYARTCPLWLGPCIFPYYVYADVDKHIIYPGNYSAPYSEELDILENPPMSMYKQLIIEEADWVVSSKGIISTYKRGGV